MTHNTMKRIGSKRIDGCVATMVALLIFVGAIPTRADYIIALNNTSGLVHHWRFSETSGTTAGDSVGSKTGTHGGPTLGAAGPRPADGFDGFSAGNVAPDYNSSENDYTSFADPDKLGPTKTFSTGVSDLTASLWFKMAEDGADNKRQILFGYQQNSGYRYNFLATRESSGHLKFYVKDSGGDQIIRDVSDYTVTDSNWHNLVFSWDGTSLRTYLDGGGKKTFTDANVSGDLAASPSMLVGKDAAGTANDLDGLVDELALFDRAITAAEVDNHYAAAVSRHVAKINELTPVHYWRFSETAGTTAGDAIGGKDGAYGTGATLGADGPRPNDFVGLPDNNLAPDLVSTSIDFNDPDLLGSDKAFSGADGKALVDELSMAFWFRTNNTSARQWLAGYTNDSESTRYNFIARLEPDGIRFYLKDSGSDQIMQTVTAFDVNDTCWHHLAMAWDGTGENEWRLYLDGADSEVILTNPNVSGALFMPTALLAGRDSGGAYALNGQIDELSIFDYALSKSEVNALYMAAVPEPSTIILLGISLICLLFADRQRRRGEN